MKASAAGEAVVKYEPIAFDLPYWPLGAQRLPVPKEVLHGGASLILSWIGEAVGDAPGRVLGTLLAKQLGDLLDDVEAMTIAISANGRVRVSYQVLEEVCDHESVVKWANFCPDCGDEMLWPKGENPQCAECDAPSHAAFNFCWACGTDFEEGNGTRSKAKGYNLGFDCDNEDCDGKVDWLMSYCPWCGEAQSDWAYDEASECGSCDRKVDADWSYCAFCGEET